MRKPEDVRRDNVEKYKNKAEAIEKIEREESKWKKDSVIKFFVGS